MAGLGKKTWSAGDTLTAADVNGYLMDQSVMVFAGTAARASAIPTPSAGMVAYSTATGLQVYNGSAWVDLSTGYGSASGTAATSTAITVSGTAYTLLTFTSDSNLVVGKAGLFDVLLVGGGGGGWAVTNGGGGGGGGGVSQRTIYLAAGTHSIVVGAGGSVTSLVPGSSSYIGTTSNAIVAVGGGTMNFNYENGLNGASTSGCRGNNTGTPSQAGIPTQGNQGGLGSGTSQAGGGGGAAAAGSAGAAAGGAGGAGADISSFLGQSAGTTYKGGGGGGGVGSGTGGTGGAGGGGNGTNGSSSTATAGTANSGGGGGGGNGSYAAGAGGSGIVYVRFKS